MVGEGEDYDYTVLKNYDLIQLEGGTVTATLTVNTVIDPAFHATAGTTSKFDIKGSHLQLNGVLTGSGTIKKAAGNGQLHFNGDASGFSGTIQNSSNYISIRNPKAAANQATYDIAAGCGMVFTPSQATDVFSLGMLTGGGTVRPGTNATTKTTAIRVGETNMNGTFSGVLQDYPIDNLIMAVEKAGTGTWILTGANTYTGATTVSGGVLQIGNATKAGSLSATTAITVTGGAALQVNNSNGEWSNSLKLNNGTLTNGMSNNGLVWKGGITLEGDNKISASSSNIRLNGTVNQVNGTTTFSISESASKIDVENAVTGKGTFRLDKTNKIFQQLHFLGDLSEFTGRIEIASGAGFVGIFKTDLKGTTLHSEGGNFFLQTADTIDTVYKVGNLSSETSGGEFRPGGSSDSSSMTLETGYANEHATYYGALKNYNTDKIILAVTKVGRGDWTLAGANTYTGATTVSEGVLQLGNADAIGTLSSATAITVTGGAALRLDNSNGNWSNSLTLNNGTLINDMTGKVLTWAGKVTLTGANTIRAREGGITLSGDIDLTGTTTIYGNGYRPNISGKVTGNGTFLYDGHSSISHQLHFTGDLSEFAGRIEITDGDGAGAGFVGIIQTNLSGTTLHSQSGNFFFQAPATSDTVYKIGNLSTATTGGVFRPGSSSQGSLLTLETGYANTDATFSGTLSDYDDKSKKLAVTKAGTGTWTVTGEQTYSGATTVAAGTLNLMGTLTKSDVTVKTGATLTGTGSISNDLTFEKDSILRVSDPTERLQVVGTLTADDLFTVAFDFDDYLSYKGEQLIFLEALNTSENWLSSLQFDFSEVGGAALWNYGFTDGAYWIQINDAAVPEPATWFLVLVGLPGLVWLIRRKGEKR